MLLRHDFPDPENQVYEREAEALDREQQALTQRNETRALLQEKIARVLGDAVSVYRKTVGSAQAIKT